MFNEEYKRRKIFKGGEGERGEKKITKRRGERSERKVEENR